MRRKDEKLARKPASLKPSLKKHLKELGFTKEKEYHAWCSARRFAVSLDKSREDMQRELDAFLNEKSAWQEHVRVHHNPERFLEDACRGNIAPQSIRRPGWSDAARAISQSDRDPISRKQLAAFLLHLNEKTKFVFGETSYGARRFPYIQALVTMHGYKDSWIRDLRDWAPDTHNTHAQFSSLLHHLFAQYVARRFSARAGRA